ncbi:MAG: hypothetical protein QGH41_13655, partial [Roseibacillus sp.]|nr:hypothetical protein [Roseibacillus sp.]
GGEHSEKARSWESYGDFVQTITRWLMGSEMPPGLGLRHRLEGTRLTIDLFYETDEWTRRFAQTPPRIKLLEGEGGGRPFEIAWKRVAPGHFSVTREMGEGQVIRGAVQAGSHALAFGPVVVGSSAEWSFDPERLAELREVSRLSGGRELLDLSQAWIRPPAIYATNLRIPLLLLALFVMLLDALVTRMGWRLPILVPAGAKVRRERRRAKARARREKKGEAPPSPEPKPGKEAPRGIDEPNLPTQPSPTSRSVTTTSEDPDRRSSRFDQAKRRK